MDTVKIWYDDSKLFDDLVKIVSPGISVNKIIENMNDELYSQLHTFENNWDAVVVLVGLLFVGNKTTKSFYFDVEESTETRTVNKTETTYILTYKGHN